MFDIWSAVNPENVSAGNSATKPGGNQLTASGVKKLISASAKIFNMLRMIGNISHEILHQ